MQVPSGTDPSPPTEPAMRGPRLSSRQSGTWFEASCARGNVRLCIMPTAQAARHAADAAITLRGVEPLLSAIDDWTGADFSWRWVEEPPRQGVHVASARWQCDAHAPECLAFWPWALLRSLPAPQPVLAAQLDWAMVAATLVLARLQIRLHELELLEPGGAVLVPQSMQPPWQGTLRGADESPYATSGVAVDLSTPWCPRLADSPAPGPACATPVDALHATFELRLDLPLGVSSQRLAGWRREGDSGDVVHLADSGLRAALWRCATPGAAEQRQAGGRLMPWGEGWAFAVETLDETPSGGDATQKV